MASLHYKGRAQGRGSGGVVGRHYRALQFGLEGRPAGVEVFPAAPGEEHGADGAAQSEGVGVAAPRPREQGGQQADGDGAEEGQGQVAH